MQDNAGLLRPAPFRFIPKRLNGTDIYASQTENQIIRRSWLAG
jgi:hypothetical protein